MKINLESSLLFVFILSCIYIINTIVKFILCLLQTPPQQLKYNVTEKIFNYLFITFFITYLILNL